MSAHPVRRASRIVQALLGGCLLVAGAAQAASVDLSITQCLSNPTPGVRGGEVTLTLNYENGSSPVATNAQLSFPLPATTEFVTGSAPAGCSHDGAVPGVVKCDFPSLRGNTKGSLSFKLKTTAATGPSISGIATFVAGAGDSDSNPINNEKRCGTSIDNGADLSADVSGPANVAAGGDITWVVSGQNNGPDAAETQTFEATLPSTLSYTGVSGDGWDCSVTGGGKLICTRSGSVVSGAPYPPLSINTRLDSSVTSGEVKIVGSISSNTTDDPNTTNNTDQHRVIIKPGADLEITQAVPSPTPVEPGGMVTYVLTTKNNGPSPASDGLSVSFELPAGFIPGSITPSGNGWGTCSWSGQIATCTHPGPNAKGWTETLTITATAPNDPKPATYDGPSDNLATIKHGPFGPLDPKTDNNKAKRPVQVAPKDAVDLALTKTKGPSPVPGQPFQSSGLVAVGSEITSLLHVTNKRGPYPAAIRSVTLTDVLELGKEAYVSASPEWECTPDVGNPTGKTTVTCTNLVEIPVGGALDLTIITRAEVDGVLTNVATARHPGQWDPIEVISSSAKVTATAQSPDLAISKSVSTDSNTQINGLVTLLDTEERLTYTLEVTNLGDKDKNPIDAVDLEILDQLPGFRAGQTNATARAVVASGNGSTAAFDCSVDSTGLVRCLQTSGVLKQNDKVTVTILVDRALSAGDLTNQASVYSTSQGDPNRDNNVAKVDLHVQPIADLEMVSKTVSPTTVKAGTNATYILTYLNRGANDSSNVVVKDTFIVPAGDPGFVFISASNSAGGSCTGLTESQHYGEGTHELTCSGFNLASGAEKTVSVVVRPNWIAGTQGTATLKNQARIYSNNTAEDTSGHAKGDPGTPTDTAIGVDRGNSSNFKEATLDVVNADLNVLIETNDDQPGGPDPLGYDQTNGGDNISNDIKYLVKIDNQGPSLATGLAFTYTMTPPAGKTMKFMGAAVNAADPAGTASICTRVGDSVTGSSLTVTCTFSGADAQLAVRGSISRYLIFRALTSPDDSGYTVSTEAKVSTNENDSNPADNVSTETTTIRVRSDIAIVVPDQKPVELREPFNWIIDVTNKGPGVSGQTDMNNSLPATMEFYGAVPTWKNTQDKTSGFCTIVGQKLDCDFGKVTVGAVAQVTAPVRFISYPTDYPTTSSVQNCASATTNQVDPVSGNNVKACGKVTIVHSSIEGMVFSDKDDNGVRDQNEIGIGGASVQLSGTDAYNNPVDITLPTKPDGSFLFDRLNSANGAGYTLTQALPVGYFDGKDTLGTAGGVPSQDSTTASTDLVTGIKLKKNTPDDYQSKAEAEAKDYLFGEIKTASLSGRVCVDSNDNGICETTESGIQGVTIELSGNNSAGVDVCAGILPTCTATSGADGAYSFAVTASDKDGFTLTQQDNNTSPLNAFVDGKDHVGDLGGTANNNPAARDSISGIVVLPDQQGINYDFGERGSSLSGLVYLDSSDDGKRDPDEPGIPGVTVTVSGKTPDGLDICPPANPSLLPLAACTAVTGPDGSYSFSGLPNGTYTVTEKQPAGYEDGKDTAGTGGGTPGAVGTDTISNVTINGQDVDGYLFGEKTDVAQPGSATVSGKVWFESSSRDKTQNSGERGLEGWKVEARNATGLLIATATTDHNGAYEFDLPAGDYSLAFHHPVSGALYGTPEAQDPGINNGTVNTGARTIELKVVGGANIVEQNLPVDPSGVVYDAVTRQPVPGAMVEISGPAGFDPAADMVGGTAAAKQMTGADGFYQFFLKPSAPSGEYSLLVTVPAGYLQAPSELIPVCQTLLTVGTAGAPQLVQNGAEAPGAGVPAHDPMSCPSVSGGLGVGSHTTQYYFRFNLNGGSDDVINNHIPLDPILGGAIVMTKTTPKVNVTRGELVPYTLTARNTLTVTLNNIVIEDQLPPGFKYVKGSAQIDGVPVEPELEGRRLRFPERTLNGGQTVVIKMLLVVGSGVGFNEYVNQTWALNTSANSRVSNVASATVRVVADPTFDCSDLIGTVYDDQNRNGYQDQGEPGIAGARVATPKGWLVTTDQHGRFHIACADVPSEMRGSNFIIKADERSLPSGYRITTENPRVVRMTQGRLVKANFGASIHRVVRLDLNSEAFGADHQLVAAYQERLDEVLTLLYAEPSILRIAYHMPVEGEVSDARKRVGNVRSWFKKQWEPNDCCYDLQLEEEIVPVTESMEVIQ